MPGDAQSYPMATTSGACPEATNPRASPRTTNSGDSPPQWAGGSGGCDATKTLPGSDNSPRSRDSQKHLWCGCQSVAAQPIVRWRQSPRCPSPQHPAPECSSPLGVPQWHGTRRVNWYLHCRGGDSCWVEVRVGFLSSSLADSRSPSLNVFSLLYPQTQKNEIDASLKYGIALLFLIALWVVTMLFYCVAKFCECDNEHLTKGSHFHWQYHKSFLRILLNLPIRFVLAMMIVLPAYV